MNVLVDLESVVKKHRTARSSRNEQIDALIELLHDAKKEADRYSLKVSGDPNAMEVDATTDSEGPKQLIEKIASAAQKSQKSEKEIAAENKELQQAVTKCVKNIDKTLPPDWSKAVISAPLDTSVLDETIVEYFLRGGRVDLAQLLLKETGKELDDSLLEPFQKVTAVCEGFKNKDLQPALIWVEENSDSLRSISSDFSFEVIKMKFLQLASHSVIEAIEFSRRNFPPYATSRLPEIQKLMGGLAFLKKANKATGEPAILPYQWDQLEDLFIRENCRLLGLSDDMPLSVCVRAGSLALPKLLKLVTVMGKTADWSIRTAPPIDVDLDTVYHSVFVCPVSREVASPENPPMLMQCGHVLCEHSLRKLSRGAARFKCPYCPVEVTVQGSMRIMI